LISLIASEDFASTDLHSFNELAIREVAIFTLWTLVVVRRFGFGEDKKKPKIEAIIVADKKRIRLRMPIVRVCYDSR